MTISSHSVLIVGAGPVGMELAAELALHDIDFLIIDKRPNSVTTSNAAGIHARTLECWHHRPWNTIFLEQGINIQGATIHTKQKILAQFDFHELKKTPYPMILSIPQNQTEKILDQYLISINKPVQRETALKKLTPQENNVTALLSTPNGDKELSFDWVVGCDGYHSTVRENANINFKGEDIEERFLLIDADLEINYDTNDFHVYLSNKGILAFFKMKESTRIIAGIGHDSAFKDVKEPTIEIMTEIIKQRTSLQFQIKAMRWQSHFWIHERIAEKYKENRIFIAGDAAHVHSPAGGQGMNTGIQDAYNLAWKLAYVIKGKAPTSLLESYEIERKPIAHEVVDMTSKMTTMANLRNPFLISLRNLVIPFITKRKIFQQIMLGKMSELAIHYPENKIIGGKKINSLAPGKRIPNFLTDKTNEKYLFDELKPLDHNLLVFNADENQKNQINALQNKYKKILSISFIKKNADDFSLCLVRPDGYIGFLHDDINQLENYLRENFL